jgi:hypothetical protein
VDGASFPGKRHLERAQAARQLGEHGSFGERCARQQQPGLVMSCHSCA